MKIIGLIGGMSWESTVPYYRQINEAIKARLGGLHSAQIILYSVDFHDIEQLQHAGDWEAAGALLASAARALEAAGADFLVLCTNTMHKVASSIEAAVTIPLLHIADPTAKEIKQAGHSTVGLLGTKFTMEPRGQPSKSPMRVTSTLCRFVCGSTCCSTCAKFSTMTIALAPESTSWCSSSRAV